MWRQYPEVKEAISTINRVVGILERNENRSSETMKRHLASINTDPVAVAKEGFYKIGQMCHPKYLGDIFLKDIPQEAWSREIERLEDACARAFNRIESEVDKLRHEEQ
jgi:hypothetical protein